MPVFRFNKAFGVARGLKVFLNLRGGVTRGALPDVENVQRHKKQAQKLRNARKRIKQQREKIKKQAETLRHSRRHIGRRKEKLRSKDREIFQLKNELRAAKEQLASATNGRPATRMAGKSETGALPDFVIIGAMKGGTTSLYDLLTQHPNVQRAALKELHYFDDNFDKGIEWYRSQFSPPRWKDRQKFITGEATPTYLSHPPVPERMAEVVPQARLIVLLRNPVDRAYSHYQMTIRNIWQTRSFEEVVAAEIARLVNKEEVAPKRGPRTSVGHHPERVEYLKGGIYVDQLLRWSRFFGQEQMLVLKSEDFYERTPETLKLVLDFLRLPDWQPEPSVLSTLSKRQNRYPRMNSATRRRLEDYFEPHNQRLYEYLGVDFGWGRANASAASFDPR